MNKKIEKLLIENDFKSFEKSLSLWSNEKDISVVLKILFLKIPFFKNRNKDSFIILKSIIFTLVNLPIMIFSVHLLLLIIKNVFTDYSINLCQSVQQALSDLSNLVTITNVNSLVWVPVLSIVYWNLRNQFAGQWLYCANLYNKISFDNIDIKNPTELLYQRCTLALDLIQVDLYSHQSFSKTFNTALEKAIYYVYENEPEYLKEIDNSKNIWRNYLCKPTVQLEILRFREGKGSKTHALMYISKLQNYLDDYLTQENSEDLKKGVEI